MNQQELYGELYEACRSLLRYNGIDKERVAKAMDTIADLTGKLRELEEQFACDCVAIRGTWRAVKAVKQADATFGALFDKMHDAIMNPLTTFTGLAPQAEEKSDTLRDAERYRWLRIDDNWGCDNPDEIESRWGLLGELSGDEFDAFIDNAMKQG